MKILLAVQGTGNGHLSRAREIIPHLEKFGTLDIVVSGTQADVSLTQPILHQYYGFSFTFGTGGGVDRWQTLKGAKLLKLIRDIRSFPLASYDLVINDFEPVTAWACKIQNRPCIALSHQASFLSSKTPRLGGKWNWAEWVLRYYAPTTSAVGFHFKSYDSFIHTPVIRSEIRSLEPSNRGHITVYLPAYDNETLISYFKRIPDMRWEVFSRHTAVNTLDANVNIFPIQNEAFNKSLAGSEGLLTGGGFEGPAEAMYLGKKVMSIPMSGQWEQQCNSEAMRLMGVTVVPQIKEGFEAQLKNWLEHSAPISVNFPDETESIVADLVKHYGKIS